MAEADNSLGERKVYRLDDNEIILSPEVQELAKQLGGLDHNLLKRLFVDGTGLFVKKSGDGPVVVQTTGLNIDVGPLKMINGTFGELLETAGVISRVVTANASRTGKSRTATTGSTSTSRTTTSTAATTGSTTARRTATSGTSAADQSA